MTSSRGCALFHWHFQGTRFDTMKKKDVLCFVFFPMSKPSHSGLSGFIPKTTNIALPSLWRTHPESLPSCLVKEKLNSLISGAATSSSASCLYLSAAAHYVAGSAALLSSCTEGIMITADGSAETTQLHVRFTPPEQNQLPWYVGELMMSHLQKSAREHRCIISSGGGASGDEHSLLIASQRPGENRF